MTTPGTVSTFRVVIEAAGLRPSYVLADGTLHRCPLEGKPNAKDGAYCLHLDSPASGWWLNWRTGEADTWTAKEEHALSPSERQKLQARIEADRRARQEAEAKRNDEAAEKARRIIKNTSPCAAHPYLARKGVKPCPGLNKGNDGRLVVPVLGSDGQAMSLQFIAADGGKLFLTGGRIRGGYFAIKGAAGRLYICEGLATGLSIHAATGQTVLCAFNAGNLEHVAAHARKTDPDRELVLCADDDHATDGNPGLNKATAAALAVGGLLAVPSFKEPAGSTDYNDLHQAEGLDVVREQLASAFAPEKRRQEQTARGLALVCAADVEPEPVNWIWPGHVSAGVVHVVDGVPGVGKSMFSCYLAGVITTGTAWPDGTRAETGNVIMVNLEDDLSRTLRPRLGAAGADLTRVFMFDDAGDGFTLPVDLDRLETAIVEHTAKLAIIDPLMAVLDGKVNSYRDQDVRRVLAALKALCGRTGCAVVLVRHLTKASGGPAIHRGGGSIGIIGAARVGLLLATDPKDDTRRILATVKNNLGPFDPKKSTSWTIAPGPRLEYAGTMDMSADDLLFEQDEKRGRGRPEEKQSGAAEWLRKTLVKGPMLSTVLAEQAEAAGYSQRTIERARKGLTESVRIGGSWQVRLTPENQDRQNSMDNEYWRSCTKDDDNRLNYNDFQGRQNSPGTKAAIIPVWEPGQPEAVI